MSYTLADIASELRAMLPWLRTRVVNEPLVGLVDGTNRMFTLPAAPVDASSLTIRDANGNVVSGYTVDEESGVVTFNSPPTNILYATYNAYAMDTDRLYSLIRAGFGEMQNRLPRNWYIVGNGGSAYITIDPSQDMEPAPGGIALSQNDVQKRLLFLCIRYAMLEAALEDRALSARLFRESGRMVGAMIDETRMPQNIAQAMEALNRSIAAAAVACAGQENETVYGSFIPGALSDEYVGAYDWWTNSRQYRGSVP